MLYGTRDVLCARKTVADYLTNMAFYLSNDRIHDFHRFGCVPPDPKYHMVLYGGPSKLVANQGAAVLAILSEGPKFTLTGNSQIKGQRPLCVDDGQFFDEASGRYLSLENILGEYLSAMPATISKFAQLLSGQ